ncbi:MAG: hypothetical protein J6I45_05355 [Clostridia bacterium]|nr:hypothetical protein [Clostridia bacterium]
MTQTMKFGSIEAVVDTFGGELISFKKDGREYAWPGDPAYWTGRAPVLFPVVCALLDNKTRFEGKEYGIQKHGLIRKKDFTLVSCDDHKAVMQITPDEECAAKYPYNFLFTVTHTLTEDGFTTTYRVENKDTRPMPFMLGGHAGFSITSMSNVTLTYACDEDCNLYYTNESGYMDTNLVLGKKITDRKLKLNPADFDRDVIVATDLKSRRINLSDAADGRSFDFIFDDFDVIGIWTPPGKDAPFVCFEPWNGAPAYVNEKPDFEDKPWIRTIAPGEVYEASYSIEIKA